MESSNKSINDTVATKIYMNLQAEMGQKFFLVEGKTDEEFIKHYLKEDFKCRTVQGAYENYIRACDLMRTMSFNSHSHERSQSSHENNQLRRCNRKEVVKRVVWELSNVYGYVDKDNGKANVTPRLYVTDTRDLETMLLSTQEDLLRNLPECSISVDDERKALFIAYQVSKLKDNLRESKKISLQFKSAVGQFDQKDPRKEWNFISDDYRVDVWKFLKFINNQCGGNEKENVLKDIKDLLLETKGPNKAKIDRKTLLWNCDWSSFGDNLPNDFWMRVNGHCIARALAYINSDVYEKYFSSNTGLNREIEFKWITRRDPKKFYGTNMGCAMLRDGVILPQEQLKSVK